MRVTFVLPFTSVEGGSRVVATYAQRLWQRGHEVVVVSCGRRRQRLKYRVKDWLVRASRAQFTSPLPPTHFDDLPHLHRRIRGPGPVEARHVPDADVIVATWWETAEWVSRLPARKGAKVHLIQHDERIFSSDPEKSARAAATWRLPDFSRIVVARWLAELGEREFGARATLVNNAVDTELFNAPPRRRNEPAVFGIMYHAREFKGTDISLAAFDIARRQIPSIGLTAFGPEPAMPHLPLPPGTPLAVMPPQPEIAQFYRSCDAYLFGSRCEGFGLPILEAMACRTPVIGTPTGAAPELIGEGGGLLVNMLDPLSMAKAILEVAQMPADRWRNMSDLAFATAQKHSWGRATDEFEAALAAAGGHLAGKTIPQAAPPSSAGQQPVVAGT